MEFGRVTGVNHVGVTVKNLEESIRFYCEMLGFTLISRQDVSLDYIFRIVSVPGTRLIRIAFLEIPGGTVLELLEYEGTERLSGSCRPCDYGSGHMCLFVSHIDELHHRLREQGVKFRSDAPVEVTAGRNKGAKIIYMMDPDGYIVELLEPPNEDKSNTLVK